MNILITGTSSGFGYETAKALISNGHHVFATMRGVEGKNRAAAEELRTFAGSADGSVDIVEMNVASDDSVEYAISHIINSLNGSLDVIINNAGLYMGGINETYSTQQVEQLFNVNVTGVHRVISAVLPRLRQQQKGTIISVTSSVSRLVLPFSGLYSASKAALESLAESYAYDLAPLGIESLIVQPGAFNTGIMEKAITPANFDRASGYKETLAYSDTLLKNFMANANSTYEQQTPALIADAIVALLNQPYGQRPLRTLVDPGLKDYSQTLNSNITKVQSQFIEMLDLTEMKKIKG